MLNEGLQSMDRTTERTFLLPENDFTKAHKVKNQQQLVCTSTCRKQDSVFSHSHHLVGVTAEVPEAQAAQEPSRRRRQEQSQPIEEPRLHDAAVHQLLVAQQRHSDLSQHIQDLRRGRADGGVGLRARTRDWNVLHQRG